MQQLFKWGLQKFVAAFTTLLFLFTQAQPIHRKEVVRRHTIIVHSFDSLASLSVGNGAFAFTVDATGLQSFPDFYAKGVPLGTQSEWGWHSFPNTKNYRFDEVLKTYPFHGRSVAYAVQWQQPGRHKEAADYFRQNLHRLHLGNIGFVLTKKDGSLVSINDIDGIEQKLDLWTGVIYSHFTIEGIAVNVVTYGHQQQDAIGVSVQSDLIKQGKLAISIRFPYPTGEWGDDGNNWKNEDKHQSTILTQKNGQALLQHIIDTSKYWVAVRSSPGSTIKETGTHNFIVRPSASGTFQFSARFDEKKNLMPAPAFSVIEANNKQQWPLFWNRGAAVDFSGSTDVRAMELERRIITSLYLTKIQCAGSQPPQETGLTYNSWYGKPHLEMHWWHGVHFALWGRTDLLEQSMRWYKKASATAYGIASRQGYKGLRWQKMTDAEGREVPSSVGAMLIWQQPHFIYFAELCYRARRDMATLQKYKDLVFATADFMASFAFYDSVSHRYVLGKGLIPAQERFKPEDTYNPTYELAYWHWALSVAQEWRQRLQLGENSKWSEVLKNLSPLPIQDKMYLAAESAVDSYTNPIYRTDHPSVLATLGMLPQLPITDTTILFNTFNWVWENWSWKDTWGWDFPMVAMTATRLGLPEKAIDALLMPIQTNTYLINGHNYQDERLRIYLPGNGGLLAAVAMMVAGYDGCKTTLPGIPKNGKWKVKYEGFRLMP